MISRAAVPRLGRGGVVSMLIRLRFKSAVWIPRKDRRLGCAGANVG